jgi:hypothetical protein
MSIELNKKIAQKLDEMAEILEQQSANPFRIRAYRRAAETLNQLEKDVGKIFKQSGRKGLIALPNIGQGIATTIAEIIHTGHWSQLERLRGNLDPIHLLQTVPGIGEALAKNIYQQLHIDTMEALEVAAYNGTLGSTKGIGQRRLAAIRASLAAILGRAKRTHQVTTNTEPSIALLLDIDRLYLESTITGTLPLIAPKRFNPTHEAWLPILHADQAGWHFTALYSNSALAHQLNRQRDWVVIYFYDDHHQEGQRTVVTETNGDLKGRRVVRGRENACGNFYNEQSTICKK